MKNLSNQTSSIAWFKLADFVARGEKERALSVLRLLMHSVDHQALTYQLEGDILAAFQDVAAVNRYLMAAELFHTLNMRKQAFAVLLQALVIKFDQSILELCVQLIAEFSDQGTIANYFSQCVKIIIERNNDSKVSQSLCFIEKIQKHSVVNVESLLYARLAINLMLYDVQNQEILHVIKHAVCIFERDQNHIGLQQFMADVKAISDHWFAAVLTIL